MPCNPSNTAMVTARSTIGAGRHEWHVKERSTSDTDVIHEGTPPPCSRRGICNHQPQTRTFPGWSPLSQFCCLIGSHHFPTEPHVADVALVPYHQPPLQLHDDADRRFSTGQHGGLTCPLRCVPPFSLISCPRLNWSLTGTPAPDWLFLFP
jgi:hypothetical protein